MKLCSLLCLSFISFSSLLSAERKPNIILISTDDLGWSDLGSYGSEVDTPHLDRLAHEGIRFTQFHNTAKCFPSRAALITGVYAQDCGYERTFTEPLRNAITIGELLQQEGYMTFWSGKHHGYDNPCDRGFDRFYGLKDGACNYFNPGYQREGEAKPAQKRLREWGIDCEILKPYTPEARDFYTTDAFTTQAITYVAEAHDKDTPFFLHLAYTAPHDPLMAWPEDIAKYKGRYDGGYEEIRNERFRKQQAMGLISEKYKLSTKTHRAWSSLSPEEREFEAKKMEVYAAMIDRLDQNIGRLLSHLQDLNMMDNTIIMLVTDNGASAEIVELDDDNDAGEIGGLDRWLSLGPDWANVANTPFRFFKNYSYQGGINTPFIVWWPERIQGNRVSEFPGHLVDIMATVIDITGAQYPTTFNQEEVTPLRGQSLLPVLEGQDIPRDTPIYWHWNAGSAAWAEGWKIVKHIPENPWELYHLEKDPTEVTNLADENPEMLAKLVALFEEWEDSYKQ